MTSSSSSNVDDKQTKSFKQTLLWGVVASASGSLVQLVVMPLVSRTLGPSESANFYSLLAISTLCALPALGVFPTLVSVVASNPGYRERAEQARIVLALSLISTIVFTVIVASVFFLHSAIWPFLDQKSVLLAAILGGGFILCAPLEALQGVGGRIYLQYFRTVITNSLLFGVVLILSVKNLGSQPVFMMAIVGGRLLGSCINTLIVLTEAVKTARSWKLPIREAINLGAESISFTFSNSLGNWLCHSMPLLILPLVIESAGVAVIGCILLLIPAWVGIVGIGSKTLQSFSSTFGRGSNELGGRISLILEGAFFGGLVLLSLSAFLGGYVLKFIFGFDTPVNLLFTPVYAGVYALVLGVEEILYQACLLVRNARSVGIRRLLKGLISSLSLMICLLPVGFSEHLLWLPLILSSGLLSLSSLVELRRNGLDIGLIYFGRVIFYLKSFVGKNP